MTVVTMDAATGSVRDLDGVDEQLVRQTARLWDVHDPRQPTPLGTLTGHTNYVFSVAFSPDGHTLATASNDHTVRLWDTSMENVTTRICSTTPTITTSEWDHYLPGLAYRSRCS